MLSKKLTLFAFTAAASFGLSACQGMFGNCVEDKDCATGEACVSGACQSSAFASCRTENDCPKGNFCPSGQCLPDCTKLGCGGGQTCNTGTHLCDFVVKTAPSNVVGGGNNSSSSSSGNSTGNGSSSSGGTTVSSNYCASCASGADCGGGNNFCLADSAGNNFCGTDCSSGQACPTSATCEQILDQANNPVGSNCVPSSGSCSAGSSSSSSSSGGTSTSSCTGFPCGGSSSGSSSSSSSSQGGSSSSGSSSSTNACTSETWGNFAQAFFANYCDSCHHHGSEFSTYSAVVSDSSSIQSEISSGYMPQNTTLSATEQNDILTWMNCGMPQ